MSLSEQEILEVQESWEIAKAIGIDTIARVFYERVFSQAPEVLEMFSFKNDENMYESASFKRHSRGILMTVGRCVAGLKDLETITPTLVTLGARHNKYGVTPAHFPIIGDGLIHTVAVGVGEKFTPAARKAWETAFDIIAQAMQLGSRLAYEAEE